MWFFWLQDKSSLLVAYVDFFQPAAVNWWGEWLKSLREQTPWDGFSLVQNQPYSYQTNSLKPSALQCPKNNSLESPKYTPSKSLCFDWSSEEAVDSLIALDNLYPSTIDWLIIIHAFICIGLLIGKFMWLFWRLFIRFVSFDFSAYCRLLTSVLVFHCIVIGAIRAWNSSHTQNLLSDGSICMVAEHTIDNATYRHSDVHSIYGHSQAFATKKSANIFDIVMNICAKGHV